MHEPSQAIRPRALYEGVADAIRDRIFAHDLPPGTPVDEVALARYYGVSRTPVREAIKVLVNEGLLRMSVFRGCCVAEVGRADLDEILDVIEMLDGHALRRMVSQAGKAGLVRLLDAYERNACASPETRGGAWSSFCEGLREALGNTPFSVVSRGLHQQLRLCLGPALDRADAGGPQILRNALRQAMIEGDMLALDNACQQHQRLFRRAILDAFAQAIPPLDRLPEMA